MIPRRAPARSAAAVAAVLLTALALGCESGTWIPTKPHGPRVPAYTIEELRAAPVYLKFDGVGFTVDVYLWRDFMPPTPPGGPPLQANVVVTAVGEPAYPAQISTAYLWALRGSESWASWLPNQGAPAGVPNARVYLATGGPAWPTGTDVDVVIGLRTSPTMVHLVLLSGIPLHRTD